MCNKAVKNQKIPVVYLDAERFKQWFIRNSYNIISQAFANKLGATPMRLTGPRYWVVAISKTAGKAGTASASDHYCTHGRKKHIWAFRDNNSPKNIMNILEGDIVVFVRLGFCAKGRSVWAYPTSAKNGALSGTGQKNPAAKDDWDIDLLDIREVKKGFHIDYSSTSPYSCFDDVWMAGKNRTPETKEYTQFIRFSASKSAPGKIWNAAPGRTLGQKLFPQSKPSARLFTDALRTSSAQRGDAIEISQQEFLFIQNLMSGF